MGILQGRSVLFVSWSVFIFYFLWINPTGCILHFFLRWPASSRALWQSSEIQVQLEPTRSAAEYSSVCDVFKKWRGEVILTFPLKARQRRWYWAKEGTGICKVPRLLSSQWQSFPQGKLLISLNPVFGVWWCLAAASLALTYYMESDCKEGVCSNGWSTEL